MSEEKETKNQQEEEQISENNDSDDLNSLTYEELLEEVDKQKEETLRAVAELENFRKRSTNEISNALKYANSELLLSYLTHLIIVNIVTMKFQHPGSTVDTATPIIVLSFNRW